MQGWGGPQVTYYLLSIVPPLCIFLVCLELGVYWKQPLYTTFKVDIRLAYTLPSPNPTVWDSTGYVVAEIQGCGVLQVYVQSALYWLRWFSFMVQQVNSSIYHFGYAFLYMNKLRHNFWNGLIHKNKLS